VKESKNHSTGIVVVERLKCEGLSLYLSLSLPLSLSLFRARTRKEKTPKVLFIKQNNHEKHLQLIFPPFRSFLLRPERKKSLVKGNLDRIYEKKCFFHFLTQTAKKSLRKRCGPKARSFFCLKNFTSRKFEDVIKFWRSKFHIDEVEKNSDTFI